MSRIPLVVLCLTWSAVGCKPNAQKNELQSFEGIDENGRSSSMTLLAVRNFTTKQAAADQSENVTNLEGMIRMPLFATIQCVQPPNSSVAPSTMTEIIEGFSLANNLFLDKDRHLVHFANSSDSLPQRIPYSCQIMGGRLVSWQVFVNAFTRTVGLPKTRPAESMSVEAVRRSYLLAQSLFLGMRGRYTEGGKQLPIAMGEKLIAMASAESKVPDAEKMKLVGDFLQNGDAMFNPCVDQVGPWFVNEFRKQVFSCSRENGVVSFKVGGTSAMKYSVARDTLLQEIFDTHLDIYGSAPSSTTQFLWDALTSTKPWSAQASTNLVAARLLDARTIGGLSLSKSSTGEAWTLHGEGPASTRNSFGLNGGPTNPIEFNQQHYPPANAMVFFGALENSKLAKGNTLREDLAPQNTYQYNKTNSYGGDFYTGPSGKFAVVQNSQNYEAAKKFILGPLEGRSNVQTFVTIPGTNIKDAMNTQIPHANIKGNYVGERAVVDNDGKQWMQYRFRDQSEDGVTPLVSVRGRVDNGYAHTDTASNTQLLQAFASTQCGLLKYCEKARDAGNENAYNQGLSDYKWNNAFAQQSRDPELRAIAQAYATKKASPCAGFKLNDDCGPIGDESR